MKKLIPLMLLTMFLVTLGCIESTPTPIVVTGGAPVVDDGNVEVVTNCHGTPDFTGTPREGEICTDNIDCSNHPPVIYTGDSSDWACAASGECCL